MQPKTTPGPWVAIGTSVFTDETEDIRFRVANVTTDNDDPTDEVSLADARLISAAPDLYAALKLLMADFEAIGAEPWHLDEARAALRKADGDE